MVKLILMTAMFVTALYFVIHAQVPAAPNEKERANENVQIKEIKPVQEPEPVITALSKDEICLFRVKYDSGSWSKYRDGTNRLLRFLNGYYSCEEETREITLKQLNEYYLSKGEIPPVLYFYCGENFSLTDDEVDILKNYTEKGGFLFLDSAPVSEVKVKVGTELRKIFPDAGLPPITKSDPINSFVFMLKEPGIGINTLTGANYGIKQDDRYVVFYTMGNFALFYSTTSPDPKFQYAVAQYQMGVNVILYAVCKGNEENITKIAGAGQKQEEK